VRPVESGGTALWRCARATYFGTCVARRLPIEAEDVPDRPSEWSPSSSPDERGCATPDTVCRIRCRWRNSTKYRPSATARCGAQGAFVPLPSCRMRGRYPDFAARSTSPHALSPASGALAHTPVYSTTMASKEEIRNRLRRLQVEVAAERASHEDELAFVHALVAQLLDDRAWLRGIADDRAERINALEAELASARHQLEALRLSALTGSRAARRRRVARIAVGVLATAASVAELSGWNIRDLVADPEKPAAMLLSVTDAADRQWLGLTRPTGDEKYSILRVDPHGDSDFTTQVRLTNRTKHQVAFVKVYQRGPSSAEPDEGEIRYVVPPGHQDISARLGGILEVENDRLEDIVLDIHWRTLR